MSLSINFGPQPQHVYTSPPEPQRPMTTGEMIFVGIILVLFIGLFIWAAATGNLQQSQPRPHYYPGGIYYKSHFANNYRVPTNLEDDYPFGNRYNPELFSSGCCS